MTSSSSSSSGQYSVPQVDETALYATETTGGAAAVPAAPSGGSGSGGSGGGSAGPTFQIEGDGIRTQAATIAQCGSQAADVLTRLRGQLAAAGEPWGTDDLGKSFGHSYTVPANAGFSSMAGLGAALVNVANTLCAQADNWDELEGLLAQKMGSIAEQTGSGGGTGTGSSGSTGSTGSGSSGGSGGGSGSGTGVTATAQAVSA